MKTQTTTCTWHAGHIGTDEHREEVVFDQNHGQVCTIIDRGAQGEITAVFIAAAPDMLSALCAADSAIVDAQKSGFRGGREARLAIAQAIAKAEGRPTP